MKYKYIVVGGNPIRSYTGTGTYTGLSVVFQSDSLEDVKANISNLYDQCGGLLIVIDCATGEVLVEPNEPDLIFAQP